MRLVKAGKPNKNANTAETGRVKALLEELQDLEKLHISCLEDTQAGAFLQLCGGWAGSVWLLGAGAR